MNFKSILSLAALSALSIFTSCKNDSKPAETTTTETPTTQIPADATVTMADPSMEPPVVTTDPAPGATTAAPTAPAAKPTEPPQNAKGVWHYTCPKGCAGGGGAAAPCAKCGTTLAHNATYHAADPAAAKPAAGNTAATATATPKPEPPQNAKGVWHYTCPDGCAGGGGAAAQCEKCGKTLAHNTVYHQ